MERVSQQCDGVSAEVEVRTGPQRAAAIAGCALKCAHTRTRRTHGTERKIDCHCAIYSQPFKQWIFFFCQMLEQRGKKGNKVLVWKSISRLDLFLNLILNQKINTISQK